MTAWHSKGIVFFIIRPKLCFAFGELWKYSTWQKTVFTRLAITPPKVNGFGWNLEYWVHCWGLTPADFGHDLCIRESLRGIRIFCYPHMSIGEVWIYRLLFVCFFCVYVQLTDFSIVAKASVVKFCTVVRSRLRQGITNFCELCSPGSPKSDDSATAGTEL